MRILESVAEVFLSCVFARPLAEESQKSQLEITPLLRIKGGEQMPVFGQASVLGGSESEVFSGIQSTGANRVQTSGLSSTDGRRFL